MSTLTDIMNADIAAIEGECPVTFIFRGQSFIGQRSATPDNFEMADAGFIPKYDCDLIVRTSIFAVAPEKNDPIVLDGKPFRVEKITTSQDNVSMTLHLVQDNV